MNFFGFCSSRCFTEGRDLSAEELRKKEEEQELPEYLQLHQMVVGKIGEICRTVNQVASAYENPQVKEHCYVMFPFLFLYLNDNLFFFFR